MVAHQCCKLTHLCSQCHTAAQAACYVSGVGLAASVAHQLVYTLPRARTALIEPLGAPDAASAAAVTAAHVVYGLSTSVHALVQVSVIGSHGALAVGLVNALRSSTVSVVVAMLFCSPASPGACLTPRRIVGAVLVSLGAAVWAAAGKPQRRERPHAD